MAFTHALATNNYGPAKFIVSSSAANGTHTTIASAITDASSGDTIFIRPGTYTENLTLKAGVCLTAYQCDAFSTSAQVTITGKASFTGAGVVTISGVQLTTNSDFAVAVTGSSASVLNLINCYINASNNTAISFTSSSASAQLFLYNCSANLGTTGIALFSHSSAGLLGCSFSVFTNSGGSSTASTCSAGQLTILNCYIANPITMSSTGLITIKYTEIDTSAVNATALTTNASSNPCYFVSLLSGSATPLVISAGSVLANALMLFHSNATAVSGSGTLIYNNIFQGNTVGTISCTTITPKGTQGMINSTAPAAGIIGQQIRAYTTQGNEVTVTNNTPVAIATIALTPGIWDVSGLLCYDAAAITGTLFSTAIVPTSAGTGTSGDDQAITPTAPTAASQLTLAIPSFRVSLASNTNYILSAYALFTVGTLKAFGRISATRVA